MSPREGEPDPALDATEFHSVPKPAEAAGSEERTVVTTPSGDITGAGMTGPAPAPVFDDDPKHIGKYEVVRELGRGSMGKVYEARHPIMKNNVAIKVILADPSERPEDVEFKKNRLFTEARRAGILAHPNIVTIKDVGSDGTTAFIVMEFVKGPTLEDWLTEDKPLDVTLSVDILKQMAEALDYAHSKNIIHRDIKPANVMIMDGKRVKVADFGIAKDLADPTATKAGVVMGTPYYMAPEQILAKPLSGATDQFALGVLAFRLLTGRRAFEADSITALLFQIVHGPLRSPLELNTTLKPGVTAVLEKALSKDAAHRYPSCRAFIEALEEAACPVRLPIEIAEPPQMRKRLIYFGLPALAMIMVVVAISLRGPDKKVSPVTDAGTVPGLPASVHLRQIVIDARNKPKAQADLLRARAEQLHRQITLGADFAALARKFSDEKTSAAKGGDMGVVPQGQIPAGVRQAAFSLTPTATSGVLESGGIFYIFQTAGPNGFPAPKIAQTPAPKPVELKPAQERPKRQPVEKPKAPPPPEFLDKD